MEKQPDFTTKLFQTFNEVTAQRVLSKGEMLLREGEVERHIYYVESGAIRVFYLSEYDEQIVRFGYEGSLINSLSSFIKGSPSEFYIEAIRKSTIKLITKENLLKLVYENEESLKQYIQLLENLVTQQIDREIDLLISSPSERLKRVLDRSPNLFQHVPLKYIASYLRMKPETLSRIRNS
jgi:CRP/FNR family transcriptional regulator, anaerobic regulatory protein